MNLANYTSSVPAARTISDIEEMLRAHGAITINKQYGPERELAAVTFSVSLNGGLVNIRLPANVERVHRVLLKARRRPPRPAAQRALLAQAERTAWKIVWEWVRVQLSLVTMEQAEMVQVFLPYVCVEAGGNTFWDELKAGGRGRFAGLLPGPTSTKGER